MKTRYALAAVALAGCTLTPGQIGKLVADLGPAGGQAGSAGSLAVTVNLSQRSVQALVSGISTVSISVQDASKSETVSDGSAGLASGVASASFSDLTPGPATVSAQALDASGSVIGSAALPVIVASGSAAASLGMGVASPSPGTADGTTTGPWYVQASYDGTTCFPLAEHPQSGDLTFVLTRRVFAPVQDVATESAWTLEPCSSRVVEMSSFSAEGDTWAGYILAVPATVSAWVPGSPQLPATRGDGLAALASYALGPIDENAIPLGATISIEVLGGQG